MLRSGASRAQHHGVGFFVSPSLRPHVHSFLAHSPRICEITIRTNPHPITVFSIYASSTVEDSSEDVARKEFFWSQLDGIITEQKNSSHIIILGDYNSRLDQFLDPDMDHIGSHVWGKRQSIEDSDRDNALYLLDFMQSHLLLLSQTYSDPRHSTACTPFCGATLTHRYPSWGQKTGMLSKDRASDGEKLTNLLRTNHITLLNT